MLNGRGRKKKALILMRISKSFALLLLRIRIRRMNQSIMPIKNRRLASKETPPPPPGCTADDEKVRCALPASAIFSPFDPLTDQPGQDLFFLSCFSGGRPRRDI